MNCVFKSSLLSFLLIYNFSSLKALSEVCSVIETSFWEVNHENEVCFEKTKEFAEPIFLFEKIFNCNELFDASRIGGVSGVTYDPKTDTYYAVTDRGEDLNEEEKSRVTNPAEETTRSLAKIFSLRLIENAQKGLELKIVDMSIIYDGERPVTRKKVDFEAITRPKDDIFILCSEPPEEFEPELFNYIII
jgi:hypothetical protein